MERWNTFLLHHLPLLLHSNPYKLHYLPVNNKLYPKKIISAINTIKLSLMKIHQTIHQINLMYKKYLKIKPLRAENLQHRIAQKELMLTHILIQPVTSSKKETEQITHSQNSNRFKSHHTPNNKMKILE